jgi:hypothetical protein
METEAAAMTDELPVLQPAPPAPAPDISTAVAEALAAAAAAKPAEDPEPTFAGKAVRQLSDEMLEVAIAVQMDKANVAMGAVNNAIGTALSAVALAETLRYEQGRRKAKP